MRLLLVEDDPLLVEHLTLSLNAQHYAVDVAIDGLSGWNYAQTVDYDLILLDIQLPKLDGISLCRWLRQKPYTGPILLLTGQASNEQKVLGLDAGADDYVVKPCSVEELCARIRALLRRGSSGEVAVLAWGELQLNPTTCEVVYRNQILPLSAKEYALLELFLRYPQRVFSSSAILEHLWTFEDAPGEETVRAHVKRLRQRLKTYGIEGIIETLYGMGYRLQPPPKLDTSKIEQVQKLIAERWQRTQGEVWERINVLEQAITAVQQGTLSLALRQQAEAAAHKLAGCLTLFGYPEGTRLGREIEQCLQVAGSPCDGAVLQELVASLRRELERSPTTTTVTTTTVTANTNPGQRVILPAEGLTCGMFENRQGRSPGVIKVLAVDDDPLVLETLKHSLPPWGIQLSVWQRPLEVLTALETISPDVLLLDVEMPEQSGIELCQKLRESPGWNELPILFLTACRDAETIRQIYAAGADDYIAKPCTEPELITRIFNRLERYRLLRSLATTDALTQVANRHQSTGELNRLLTLSQQYQLPFCLGLVDINQLRAINEQYGHAVGDRCLKQVARILQFELPEAAIIARWGGDEFVVGLYGIGMAEAQHLLGQVSLTAQQKPIVCSAVEPLLLTLNVGIAECPTHATDLQSLYWIAARSLSSSYSFLYFRKEQ